MKRSCQDYPGLGLQLLLIQRYLVESEEKAEIQFIFHSQNNSLTGLVSHSRLFSNFAKSVGQIHNFHPMTCKQSFKQLCTMWSDSSRSVQRTQPQQHFLCCALPLWLQLMDCYPLFFKLTLTELFALLLIPTFSSRFTVGLSLASYLIASLRFY